LGSFAFESDGNTLKQLLDSLHVLDVPVVLLEGLSLAAEYAIGDQGEDAVEVA
jgi:hypothetical protein